MSIWLETRFDEDFAERFAKRIYLVGEPIWDFWGYSFSVHIKEGDIKEVSCYMDHGTGRYRITWKDNYNRPAGKEEVHNIEQLIEGFKERLANPYSFKENGLP